MNDEDLHVFVDEERELAAGHWLSLATVQVQRAGRRKKKSVRRPIE